MTRTELLITLHELNITQAELARKIGRHPVTIARWGIKWDVPAFAVEFIEMMKKECKAGIVLHALNSNAQCINGHNLNEYIGIKNGQLICSFCGINIEQQGVN